jgi:hypothetical protein
MESYVNVSLLSNDSNKLEFCFNENESLIIENNNKSNNFNLIDNLFTGLKILQYNDINEPISLHTSQILGTLLSTSNSAYHVCGTVFPISILESLCFESLTYINFKLFISFCIPIIPFITLFEKKNSSIVEDESAKIENIGLEISADTILDQLRNKILEWRSNRTHGILSTDRSYIACITATWLSSAQQLEILGDVGIGIIAKRLQGLLSTRVLKQTPPSSPAGISQEEEDVTNSSHFDIQSNSIIENIISSSSNSSTSHIFLSPEELVRNDARLLLDARIYLLDAINRKNEKNNDKIEILPRNFNSDNANINNDLIINIEELDISSSKIINFLLLADVLGISTIYEICASRIHQWLCPYTCGSGRGSLPSNITSLFNTTPKNIDIICSDLRKHFHLLGPEPSMSCFECDIQPYNSTKSICEVDHLKLNAHNISNINQNLTNSLGNIDMVSKNNQISPIVCKEHPNSYLSEEENEILSLTPSGYLEPDEIINNDNLQEEKINNLQNSMNIKLHNQSPSATPSTRRNLHNEHHQQQIILSPQQISGDFSLLDITSSPPPLPQPNRNPPAPQSYPHFGYNYDLKNTSNNRSLNTSSISNSNLEFPLDSNNYPGVVVAHDDDVDDANYIENDKMSFLDQDALHAPHLSENDPQTPSAQSNITKSLKLSSSSNTNNRVTTYRYSSDGHRIVHNTHKSNESSSIPSPIKSLVLGQCNVKVPLSFQSSVNEYSTNKMNNNEIAKESLRSRTIQRISHTRKSHQFEKSKQFEDERLRQSRLKTVEVRAAMARVGYGTTSSSSIKTPNSTNKSSSIFHRPRENKNSNINEKNKEVIDPDVARKRALSRLRQRKIDIEEKNQLQERKKKEKEIEKWDIRDRKIASFINRQSGLNNNVLMSSNLDKKNNKQINNTSSNSNSSISSDSLCNSESSIVQTRVRSKKVIDPWNIDSPWKDKSSFLTETYTPDNYCSDALKSVGLSSNDVKQKNSNNNNNNSDSSNSKTFNSELGLDSSTYSIDNDLFNETNYNDNDLFNETNYIELFNETNDDRLISEAEEVRRLIDAALSPITETKNKDNLDMITPKKNINKLIFDDEDNYDNEEFDNSNSYIDDNNQYNLWSELKSTEEVNKKGKKILQDVNEIQSFNSFVSPTSVAMNLTPNKLSSNKLANKANQTNVNGLSDFETLAICIVKAWDLPEGLGETNPYVVVDWGEFGRISTKVVLNTTKPKFGTIHQFSSIKCNNRFISKKRNNYPSMKLYVYNRNVSVCDELIGEADIDVNNLKLKGKLVSNLIDLKQTSSGFVEIDLKS